MPAVPLTGFRVDGRLQDVDGALDDHVESLSGFPLPNNELLSLQSVSVSSSLSSSSSSLPLGLSLPFCRRRMHWLALEWKRPHRPVPGEASSLRWPGFHTLRSERGSSVVP